MTDELIPVPRSTLETWRKKLDTARTYFDGETDSNDEDVIEVCDEIESLLR